MTGQKEDFARDTMYLALKHGAARRRNSAGVLCGYDATGIKVSDGQTVCTWCLMEQGGCEFDDVARKTHAQTKRLKGCEH